MATANLTVPIILNWKDVEGYLAQHDIIEVIRCKDCKWFDACKKLGWIRFLGSEDSYCSKGERRADGTD